jgi:kinetochore protein Spc7/SPC105
LQTDLSAAKVDNIEKEHGWTITGVSGTTTSMTYRKEIELVFDASSFQSNTFEGQQPSNSRIDLWYIAANRELSPLPLTPEKEFFLQSIRDHIRGLPQAQTQVKDLLAAVSGAWNKANAAGDHIRLLRISCPTEITKTSDNSILVKSMLMIAPLTTKVEIVFHLTSHSGETGIDVEISPNATVVYVERFNEPKMKEFLLNRCGDDLEERGKTTKVSWGAAVAELSEKLLARGRK